MCRSKRFIFLTLILLCIVWSCAETKPLVPNESIKAKTAAPVKDDSNTTTEASAQAARLAKNKMDAGEYQEAIAIFHVAHQNFPQSQSLLKDYAQSIEKIKSIADELFDHEDFVSALRHYAILIKNYPNYKDSGIKLSFNNASIEKQFSISKKMISRQGFEEYRKGNLSQAIALWQALIDIDQNDPDIIRALKTAKLQQKNL